MDRVINHSYIIYPDRYKLPTNHALDIYPLNQGLLFSNVGAKLRYKSLFPLIVGRY